MKGGVILRLFSGAIVKLEIRHLEKSDYNICQQIFENQQLIWNMPASEAMPVWKLLTIASTGGLLIGAFEKKQNVAHALLTPARDPLSNEAFLYLDMIGVLPEFRSNKLGERMLRLAQEKALQLGYKTIQWTFDPLESANANLYIRKLGAHAIRFYPDYYGPVEASNNAVATDRFWMRWQLYKQKQLRAMLERIIKPDDKIDADYYSSDRLAIEIPRDFQTLIKDDVLRAEMIRYKIRDIFWHLFQSGFIIKAFVSDDNKNYYVAIKD